MALNPVTRKTILKKVSVVFIGLALLLGGGRYLKDAIIFAAGMTLNADVTMG